MRKFLVGLTFIVFCLSLAACGGSNSNLKRLARRNSPDDGGDDAPPSAPADSAGAKTVPKAKAAPANKSNPATTLPPGPPAAADETPAPTASNEKPTDALSETERRARSIANLEKIGKALVAYKKKRRRYPPPAMSDDRGDFLSWRVTILPELGYADLFARFHPNEAWDSPHNKVMLEYIPPEYQSPERFDLKTNYLGLVGPGMLLASYRGTSSAELKDGAENTLAVVEVDDRYAQEWTRPVDHVPQLDQPSDRLGGLRGDGAFGVLANGRVVLLARDLSPARLGALFTIGGGEPIGAATFLKAPSAEPPPPMLASAADNPDAVSGQMTESAPAPNVGAVEKIAESAPPPPLLGPFPYMPDLTKEPLPDEASLAKSRELLRSVYSFSLERARTPQQRREFAKKLLTDAPSVSETSSDFHEVVRAARDLAAGVGDVATAVAACTLLEQRFQVDPLPMQLALLQSLNEHAKQVDPIEPALKKARSLAQEAFEADRYDIALPAQELVLEFARLTASRDKPAPPGPVMVRTAPKWGSTPETPQEKAMKAELSRLQLQLDMLEACKSLHAAAQRGLSALEASGSDAAAHEAVGKYLCLVKGRWDAGLSYLSRAGDIRLRGIASLELASDRSQRDTLSLADQHWELADRFKQPLRRGFQLRAAYCYAIVASGMASSLERAKVQRRIDEAALAYGKDELDRVLAPLQAKKKSVVGP